MPSPSYRSVDAPLPQKAAMPYLLLTQSRSALKMRDEAGAVWRV